MKEYALYKGDEILSIGTIKEIAKELNVSPETIRYYKSHAYKNKLAKRKKCKNIRTLICLEDEDETSMGKKLSEKDKQFLNDNWLKMTNETLAESLGVSASSITVNARRLGLPDKRDFSLGNYKGTKVIQTYEPSEETLQEIEGRKLTEKLFKKQTEINCDETLKIKIREHGLSPVRIVLGKVIQKNDSFIALKLDNYVECFKYVDFYTGKAAVIYG